MVLRIFDSHEDEAGFAAICGMLTRISLENSAER